MVQNLYLIYYFVHRCFVVNAVGHKHYHTRGRFARCSLHTGRVRYRVDRLLHMLPDVERYDPDFQAQRRVTRHVK